MNRMPRRLPASSQSALMSPLLTGMIALRLRRGTSEHYHDLAASIMIAHRLAGLVPRHRHLQEETQAAMSALNSMFERWKQRTVSDAYVAGTDDEIDALDTAVQVYAALLKASHGKYVRRALLNVNDATREAA